MLNLAAVGVFAMIAWILSRLAAFRQVSASKSTYFLMFLSIIGILAIILESLPIPIMIESLLIPLVGLMALAYMAEFVHQQAHLARCPAFVFSLISLTGYYLFRGLTMR